ncbi:MAG: ERCC4 domain-containing protein [bacterium]
MKIAVDDRECKAGVLGYLRRMENTNVEILRLEVGDYCVDNRLVVERKTLPDFAASVIDGRLFQQATRLANSGKQAIVLLEGTAADLADAGLRREALQGALITLSVVFGIPVLRALDAAESARLIYYVASQVERVAHGAAPRHGYRPKKKRRRQLHILQGLPGVGPEKAQRLLETFGTVEGVMTAQEKHLIEVHGIGSRTAAAIRWAVMESRGANYGAEIDPVL